MHRFFKFWWRCAQNAFWGNAPFANDWQWLIGYPVTAVLLAAIAYFYAELSGKIELTLTNGALGTLIAALVAYVITWLAAFVVRLLNQPVVLFEEQRQQIGRLLGKAQSSNDEIEAPAFGVGYEFSKFDEEEHRYSVRERHALLRIWVENLAPRPLSDCRVVVEKIEPQAPITNGALLIPDQRGAEEQASAEFHLAVTERRYFKFLVVRGDMFAHFNEPKNWRVIVKSDQDGTSWTSVLDRKELAFGMRYFVTIAVHGKDATSKRISLSIELTSVSDIRVTEVSAPPAMGMAA